MGAKTTEASRRGASTSEQKQIFFASCMALIATSMIFSIRADILGAWGGYFKSNPEQIGLAIAPAFWGFTISIFIGGQICDWLGMKALLGLAFVAHVVGVVLTILAPTIGVLASATLIIGLGNGFVEAGVNPLVATLYTAKKTERLNALHAWWPGGQIIGGVAAFLVNLVALKVLGLSRVDQLQAVGHVWQIKMAVILLPVLIYGFLFLKLRLPATERVQTGVTTKQMYSEMLRPLFLVFLFGMLLSAATELGTMQWIAEIMQKVATNSGILVLVWINILMLAGRLSAGRVVHRISPVGLLTGSAAVSAIGLLAMSVASSALAAYASSFVFAVGVCYFWPTMLGITSERFPRGGALLLGLMGAAGMASAGAAQPLMGNLYKNFGAGGALARMAILPSALFVIYCFVYLYDRSRGGYKAVKLGADETVLEGEGAQAPVR